MEERLRELDRDRRSLSGGALDLETTATDLRAFTHHRHAEVTFGAWGFRVEADSVVLKAQHDVVVFFENRDPHIPGLCMLEGVHHTLAGDVIHEQRDRGWEIDVLDVAMEADRRIAANLLGERLERFREPLGPQRGPMQISDKGTDPVGRLLLRMTDLVELRSHIFRLTLLQQLACDIHLDGEAEQHLSEIVVEVPGDLEPFVGPFLGHGVRE